jgi:hypothetical protein
MAEEDKHDELETNFHMVFYASVNQGAGGDPPEPPSSPSSSSCSSSENSHHSHHSSHKASFKK